MEDNPHLSVIQIWSALAWADGVVVPAERMTLRRLVAAARELSERERQRALGWLDQPVALEEVDVRGLDREARAGIYRAAVGLAAVDGEIHATERALLGRLGTLLELGAEATRQIEAAISARG
jgi:uncharacterized tellurite resistance protein B-like protein